MNLADIKQEEARCPDELYTGMGQFLLFCKGFGRFNESEDKARTGGAVVAL